ncbi:MAG: VOC family protein [Gemmatimonadetes bacterium]|nr:VOC family protein [Gemmatimonadota bacterium]
MRLLLIAAAALLIASPARAQLAPENDMGVTYGHVHLNVADIDASMLLFAEHFGGEIVVKGSLHTVKFPNFLLAFSGSEPTSGSGGTVMDHFGFKVRDIEPVLEGWEAAGLETQDIFVGAEGYKNAFVITPEGARVELQEDPQLTEKATGYHIHFWTDQSEVTSEYLMNWYADHFGAEIHPRGRIQTSANVPGMNLSCGNCSAGNCTPTQGTAIDHVGFEVDNLEQVVAQLQARGVELTTPYRYIDSIDLCIAYFVDPAGTRVELTEGYDDY